MAGKCPVCGAPMQGETCGYCGYIDKITEQKGENMNSVFTQRENEAEQWTGDKNSGLNHMNAASDVSQKSKTVALLLCIFLGIFGAHRFYAGKVGTGVLYLFTGGFVGIGWIIDIISIASGSFRDGDDLRICH